MRVVLTHKSIAVDCRVDGDIWGTMAEIPIATCHSVADADGDRMIRLQTKLSPFFFRAPTMADKEAWISAISSRIEVLFSFF